MNARKAGFFQRPQRREPFVMNILGGTVDGDAFEVGKNLAGKAADFRQRFRLHGDGVTGGEKQGANVLTVYFLRFQNIFLDFGDRADFEGRPFFIDHAEGAAVVRAADRSLDQ
jgi:hypothetical protein